ncbi:MAG: metallopeptidase TldD-related protein, partial [Bacillota bacterium]
VIPAGERPLADMLAGIRDGILVENFMGAWSGNLYAGVVTGNVALGYRVRGGERVGRVKDCMFSVNAFTALKEALGGISRETRRLGSLSFPYLLLERATITSRSD